MAEQTQEMSKRWRVQDNVHTREQLWGWVQTEDGIEICTWSGARKRAIMEAMCEAHNRSLIPHAPASTANEKELVEKYARTITVNSPDIIKEFDAGVEVSEVATDILTRFASEITVDAEKVDVRNTAINILGKLGSLFQECTEYDQSGFDQEPEERFDSEKWQREGIKIIAAAISAAGGGKDGNNG